MTHTITLNNGVAIPQIGFGVFQVPDSQQCEEVVLAALQAGYRHIDTAAAYMNEAAVGAAIRKSGIPREEIFVTSKLWLQDFGYEHAKKGIETSLEQLGVEYIDLYLLHQAMGDYIGAWRALEEAYQEGKIKAIGISNFYPERFVDFCESVTILPAVHQIEAHPFFQRDKDLAVAKEYGVAIEAWGPFAEGKFNIFQHPLLTEIGEQYGKTAAQVALRWNLDRGVIVLPKTVTPSRMSTNIDVLDFTLSEKDHARIAKLDMGHSEIVNHYDPAFVKAVHGFRIHDKW